MKYIMFEQTIGTVTRKVPIIFPSILNHSDIAQAINPILASQANSDVKVISAGEVNNLMCGNTSGKSTTLKLEADGADAEVINLYDYFHGIVY